MKKNLPRHEHGIRHGQFIPNPPKGSTDKQIVAFHREQARFHKAMLKAFQAQTIKNISDVRNKYARDDHRYAGVELEWALYHTAEANKF